MARTHRLGQVGEDLVAEYLTGLGWQILDRNYRRRGVELDIVARDPKRGIVFVEVKTRSARGAATAWESITEQKMRFLRRGAAVWLSEHERSGSVCMDAVVVKVRGSLADIEQRKGVL
ncbi:YraN family protein [Actinomyces sp. S4-C9]|uniref:YraN family protein n=1 Tax=Actinomyces sp. S4-C9 TaxID=1219581 RepID=UPI00050FA728|nr:YraN family protein [Actinomyces sp. S4-C9]KGF00150.1 hypothetical protein HMPREF1628_08040 [Actinomyces sp. S4-C9]